MGIWDIFSGTKSSYLEDSVQVDMHNHLLYGLDDGSSSVEQSLDLIVEMQKLGRKKIIMTPHVMSDFYKNTNEIILSRLQDLKQAVLKANIDVSLEAAAEYYIDEHFIKLVENNDLLLSMGAKKYVLVETAFTNECKQLNSVIFNLKSNGYAPILAHPERYLYLHNDFELYENIFEKGILFQINLLSLTGYYSKDIKKIVEKLIDAKMVNFVSSDCHNMKHMQELQGALTTKYYQKLLQLPLLNNSLL